MNETTAKRIISGRSMKLVAGGLSLVVLALLAVLTAGFLADDSEPSSTAGTASTSISPEGNVSAGDSSSPSRGPALHSAIAKNDRELVRILIEGGANVNVKDVFGDTPLHAAIEQGNNDMVILLVEAEANVDAKDSFGDTALHRAISKGDTSIVRTLVDALADVNLTNAFGDSALELAVSEGDQEILQILLDAPGR